MPTVADHVAPDGGGYAFGGRAGPPFHPDSYGYRPNKAAWDGSGACRQRCWKFDWVIDLDVRFLDGRNFLGCPFERYADDAVVHCVSRRQAEYVLAGIAGRMEEVGLRYTRRKRGSSTVRMVGAGEIMSTPASPFSGSPSGHEGKRRQRMEVSSSVSCPP